MEAATLESVTALALSAITPSESNPRRHFDERAMNDLTASVREHGVIQPILVRPRSRGKYEIVCGERRYRAATEAGLTEIPGTVRELTDLQVLEIQVVENLQRDDLHPLEEAEGYRRLMLTKTYTVERIAERVGRSAKYVYDRVKLLQLTPEAKKLFLEGRFTAGHAILLASLSPADQKRAMDPVQSTYADGGLFREDASLFMDYQERAAARKQDPYGSLVAGSVREFARWIDDTVRFDPKAPAAAELFPETVAAVTRAEQEKSSVVLIARNGVDASAVKGQTIYDARAWRPADGETRYRNDAGQMVKGKVCEHSVLGVVALGEGRGQSLDVCVDRKCEEHWPKPKKAPVSQSLAQSRARQKAQDDRWTRERKARELQQERWKKAGPAIVAAVAESVKKATIAKLGELMLVQLGDLGLRSGSSVNAKHLVPRGAGAEALMRHVVYRLFAQSASQSWQTDRSAKYARVLGVNVAKVLDQAAPKSARATPRKKK